MKIMQADIDARGDRKTGRIASSRGRSLDLLSRWLLHRQTVGLRTIV